MDQALFTINFQIVGMEIDLFIETLKAGGFEQQALIAEEQILKQIKEA